MKCKYFISEQMHIRLDQAPKYIKTKLPNDEEIRP